MIALVEILGTAHDLERLGIALRIDVVLAYVDFAYPHVIGVGMRFLLDHLGSNYMVESIPCFLDALDARSGEVEPIAERLQVSRYFDVLVKPFQ